jgi:hypothetical protein
MNRRNVFAIVVALALGYWLASSPSSPIPAPAPTPSRPVVRWIAKVAKNFLWIALVAEKPPVEPQPDHQVARAARIGDDGYPIVDNAKGW